MLGHSSLYVTEIDRILWHLSISLTPFQTHWRTVITTPTWQTVHSYLS